MRAKRKRFALCLDNSGNEASLIVGKVYRVLPDAKAARDNFVRIVDEEGEDYLYEASHFVFPSFEKSIEKKIQAFVG